MPLSVPLIHAADPTDLMGVHKVYHDLAEVFRKDRALSLLPHRPYDSTPDLLPGSPLSTSQLYNFSKPKCEAMERFINVSLAAGMIRPSSSLLGSGFFFVDKISRPCTHALISDLIP